MSGNGKRRGRPRRDTRISAKRRREKAEFERKLQAYLANPTPYEGTCRLMIWVDAPGGERVLVHLDRGEVELRKFAHVPDLVVAGGMLSLPAQAHAMLRPSDAVVIRARRAGMLPFEFDGRIVDLDLSRPVLFEDILITRPEIWGDL